MFTYCNNNPVLFSDHTGENPSLSIWIGTAGPAALLEPSFIGEVIVVSGIVVLLVVELVNGAKEIFDTLAENSDETEGSTSQAPPAPDVDYPGDDPSVAPGEDYEWHGKPNEPPGSDKGAWVNKNTGEQWHPDFNHKLPKGPHWDYTDPFGIKWAVTYELGKTVFRQWDKAKIIIEIWKN